MALATLCHKTRTRKQVIGDSSPSHRPIFKAFIVNHKLRPGSGEEANSVADALDKLDIIPQILDLEWPGHGDPATLPNLESAARRLRYQALGRACRDNGISSLLVAHHADDQAETAFMRIVTGYTGIGLSGMKHCAALPECQGVYGIDHSGEPCVGQQDVKVESGGVCLHRPLLDVRKRDMVDVCVENGVRWFEDSTNKDVTLTLRNTVRSLLRDGSALPNALRHERLLVAAEKMAQKKESKEAEAAKLLATTSVSMNVRSGQTAFTLDQEIRTYLSRHEDVAGRLLRQILIAVSPKAAISLQDLDQAVALMLSGGLEGKTNEGTNDHVHIASVQMRRLAQKDGQSSDASFVVSRLLPPSGEQKGLTIQLWPQLGNGDGQQSDAWRLWDGRYWIRVQPPQSGAEPGSRVVARFLNRDGLAGLQKLSKAGGNAAGVALDRLKKITNLDVRLSLPAVFLIRARDDAEDQPAEEELVALPSLSWYARSWTGSSAPESPHSKLWVCEIRYKHVELGENQVHDSMSGVEGE